MSDFVNKLKIRYDKYVSIWNSLPYNMKVFVYCLLGSIGIILFTGLLWQGVLMGGLLFFGFRKKVKGNANGKFVKGKM